MSQTARKEFEGARSEQLQRNEARNMRKLVSQARGDVHRAGNRWPFELTQNAHDPGPRNGNNLVNVLLTFDGQNVIYEHDGKPFSMRDLAALLSGGSNKDFESQETTGRFGTGFLLTHVLSERIDFTGILEVGSGYEKVVLQLDRSGDEDHIFDNILRSQENIGQAEPMTDLKGIRTAQFRYITDNPEAARIGIRNFSQILPYLYGTCEHLGEVVLAGEDGKKEIFVPGVAENLESSGFLIRQRDITKRHDATSGTLRAIQFSHAADSASSLLIVLEKEGSVWRVVPLPEGFPRFFDRLPIRTSDFLPVNVVIDGRFDLSVERDAILMKEKDTALIAEAIGLLPLVVQKAIQDKWQNGFKLAQLGMPKLIFGEPLDDKGRQWWETILSGAAKTLAKMPIVLMANGEYKRIALPAPNADFIVPRLDANQSTDELDFDQVWKLANDTKNALPAALEIAREWTRITQEWLTLGVASERLTLASIGELARPETKKLADLQTETQALTWLSRFLNLVGQIAPKHNCSKVLTNFLPDQNDELKSPSSLKRDGGIEDELKRISVLVKLDVRAQLLSNDLLNLGDTADFPHLKGFLHAQIPQVIHSHEVIESCIGELSKQLVDSKAISPEKIAHKEASMDLLLFLWKTKGIQAADTAKKCPLIASDGTAVHWSPSRKMMAPVSHWHSDAQPFAKIYKDDRILSEEYLTRFKGDKTLVAALVKWEMVFPDPLITDTPKEIRGDRLKPILVPGQGEGIAVGDVEMSQIALLPTELIQRCDRNEPLAKLLLGLVLKYVANQDSKWLASVSVPARSGGKELLANLFPALWIADLKSKAWVPLAGGEAGWSNVPANVGTMKQILDPAWLDGNNAGIRLLATFFGYKELELRLLATALSDEELRRQMENGLAKIVQTLGSNAGHYTELAEALDKKRRQDEERQRNRKFGFAVQDAIKDALEKSNLTLELVDHGYDYDVYLEDKNSIEAATLHLQLADYLLEVKATTSGEVRLTPTQAKTASENSERYILCVVDLRGISREQMEGEWHAHDVEPNVKILKHVGELTDPPHSLVEEAKACDVGVRNDEALRYGVPVRLWEHGVSIAEWMAELGK